MTGLGISLFATACISGTLHGVPTDLCREFQIRHYETLNACEAAHDKAIAAWLDGMKPFRLDLRLAGSRCGPAEADQDGNDI